MWDSSALFLLQSNEMDGKPWWSLIVYLSTGFRKGTGMGVVHTEPWYHHSGLSFMGIHEDFVHYLIMLL